MTDIPTIPATVTKIEVPEPPAPPRWIAMYWVPGLKYWAAYVSADKEMAVDAVRMSCPHACNFHLIDTQPEPQPAGNEAVIAELEELVPKVCGRCSDGLLPFRPGLSEEYFHGGYVCWSGPLHKRIAELRGEK